MIAGVIGKVLPAALAPEDLTSENGRAATKNSSDGAPVRRQEACAKLLFIRRPVAAQNFGQRNQGPKWLEFGWLVEGSQCSLGARLADRSQVGVDHGGVE
jgi:hypothetical protein